LPPCGDEVLNKHCSSGLVELAAQMGPSLSLHFDLARAILRALTRSSKQTVIDRARRETGFAKALLDEARIVLTRFLVNATVGFERLSLSTGKTSKSLYRILSPNGNASMDNHSLILRVLAKRLGATRTVNAA
jgi:DNA-binding phage protein